MVPRIFFAAPHRVMFAGGGVQLLLVMLIWGAELALRYGAGGGLLQAHPPAWIHAGLMLYGLFPWFIFGFLMTALPKWMQVPAISGSGYLLPFGLLTAGWLLVYGGLVWPALLLPGLGLACLGMLAGTVVLYGVVVKSGVDKRHGYGVVVANIAGALGLASYALALGGESAGWFQAAVNLGVWAYLAPVFFTVLHRMLPFFSASVIPNYKPYGPMWVLGIMWFVFYGHAALVLLDLSAWTWPLDGVGALMAAYLSWRWGLLASLKNPMLAVLHLGALWLPIALGLHGIQSLLLALGTYWGGLFPLHSLVLGFFMSIVIGMGTRVTRGHSGMVISEDRWVWPLFWVFQGVVLLRGWGEFGAAFGAMHPYVSSAGLWLVVFGLWVWHYWPLYFRPRQDGQPG